MGNRDEKIALATELAGWYTGSLVQNVGLGEMNGNLIFDILVDGLMARTDVPILQELLRNKLEYHAYMSYVEEEEII